MRFPDSAYKHVKTPSNEQMQNPQFTEEDKRNRYWCRKAIKQKKKKKKKKNKVRKRYRKKIEHQGNLLTQQRKLPKRNEGYKSVFIWNSKQTKNSKYENAIENVGIEGQDWLTYYGQRTIIPNRFLKNKVLKCERCKSAILESMQIVD